MINYFKIVEIVEDLRNTTKSTEKLAILKANKDNGLLQKVLEYTYNPYKKYKITEDTFSKYNSFNCDFEDIFDLLNLLAKSNITDYLKNEAVGFVNLADPRLRDLFKSMLVKDLRIGCNAKTINKVWEGLIPEFGCMLAKSYYKDNGENRVKGEFMLTKKEDGTRLIVIKENGVVKAFTRQGKEVEDIVELFEEIESLNIDDVVFDGELLSDNEENLDSADLFRKTRSIVSKDGEKKGLNYILFDLVDLEGFKKGIDKTPCRDRKNKLKKLLEESNCKRLKIVKEYYIGKDKSVIKPLLDKVVSEGSEGLILNVLDAPYSCKRSYEILKLKKFHSADVECIGLTEGTGKYKDAIGSIKVRFLYEGKYYETNVGTGISDDERFYYWENQNEIIGKIIQIDYFEISNNKNNDEINLRFASFKGVRNDKNEENYD